VIKGASGPLTCSGGRRPAVDAVSTRHVTVGSSFLSGIFDLRVVDGAVNLIARVYDVASGAFRRLQVGFTQGYAMVMVFGAAILLVVFLVSF
jgi:NADH:ubiquinone oxidoreductase subunit 5 (subunit L)/multisubunit Na+/H+ antiporter MnhA subunit